MLCQLTLLVFTLLLFVGNLVASDPNCPHSELTKCIQELTALKDKHGLLFGETEDDLSKKCGQYDHAIQCVDSFTNRCFQAEPQKLYRTASSGTREYLSAMCTQGSEFREEYLTHVDCYQKANPDYLKCVDRYTYLIKDSVDVWLDTEEETLQMLCGIFKEHLDCTRKVIISNNCSSETEHFTTQFLTRYGGDRVRFLYPEIHFNASECASYIFSSGISQHLTCLKCTLACLVFIFIRRGLFCNVL